VQEALSQQELGLLDALPGAANMINFTMLSCVNGQVEVTAGGQL
jgi:hypothetical protein